MLTTFDARSLLTIINEAGEVGNPEHELLRATIQAAVDAGAKDIVMNSDETSLLKQLLIEKD